MHFPYIYIHIYICQQSISIQSGGLWCHAASHSLALVAFQCSEKNTLRSAKSDRVTWIPFIYIYINRISIILLVVLYKSTMISQHGPIPLMKRWFENMFCWKGTALGEVPFGKFAMFFAITKSYNTCGFLQFLCWSSDWLMGKFLSFSSAQEH